MYVEILLRPQKVAENARNFESGILYMPYIEGNVLALVVGLSAIHYLCSLF